MTGVSPSAVVAGGPSFTITVTGSNFAQGDTVDWNDAPLASTFVSSTEMTAQVPHALLYKPDTASIIVQTPVPNALNFGATITISSPPPPGNAGFALATAAVQANDMVWDPVSQQIYLSVAGTNPTNPNTITALNPVTGRFGPSVSPSAGANRLAVSSDGSWLYAGIDANSSVQRFALPGFAPDITIPLGIGPGPAPYYAIDLEAAPQSPNTIAVSKSTAHYQSGSVVIYDGSTPRSTSYNSADTSLGTMVWNSDGSDVFAGYNQLYGDTVFVLSANSAGVQLSQTDQLNQTSESVTLGGIHYSTLTGYLYGDAGAVIDPFAGQVVNQLEESVVAGGTFSNEKLALALDDNLAMAWVAAPLLDTPAQQMTIEAFDLRTNALLGSIAVPGVVDEPVKLIRWGSNGLALLTGGAVGPQAGDGVYIISGTFVTTPSAQDRGTTTPPVAATGPHGHPALQLR